MMLKFLIVSLQIHRDHYASQRSDVSAPAVRKFSDRSKPFPTCDKNLRVITGFEYFFCNIEFLFDDDSDAARNAGRDAVSNRLPRELGNWTSCVRRELNTSLVVSTPSFVFGCLPRHVRACV